MNILKEKGIALDKQVKTWHDIVKRPFNRDLADCYTRTRQILMNGIEVEAWGFKHSFVRNLDDLELKKTLVSIRRIEDMQQSTMNWLTPYKQTVLDTTLGYEQVAVDLTAWLAQNEADPYVRETFDFGLLEDFDHLYRYCQFASLIEETDPNEILHNQTDVMLARPTQYHHNCNAIRIRKPYDRNKTSPQTKVNILTLVSAEQQTHNFYAEHGFMYGNTDLKRLYAEICDVEEEHVTMYETLIDPNETMFEKWLLHEFCEACCYYNCYKDEIDSRIKQIYEEMFMMEVEHVKIASQMLEKYENKDASEIIGTEIVEPCHFESQKEYVEKIIKKETNKRVDENGTFNTVDKLDDSWASYAIQEATCKDNAPSEQAIHLSAHTYSRDVAIAKDSLLKMQDELLEKSLEKYQAPNTMTPDMYREFEKVDSKAYLY
ncbi:MAG: hypothetical protein IKL52_02085 [Candidatus Gastranaerophilales bacterium]|nr:hypothetical protein [Candidatus Gastranaerophilales bacterium]